MSLYSFNTYFVSEVENEAGYGDQMAAGLGPLRPLVDKKVINFGEKLPEQK